MAQCSSPEVKNKSKSPKKERKEAIGWSTDPMRAWGICCCFILCAPNILSSFGDLAGFQSQHVHVCTRREGGVLV